MGAIRIEQEDPVKADSCGACGGTNRLMRGYVYEDEHPRGIYFVEWCDGNHSHRTAWLTIGLGEFGEEFSAADRNSFCIEWRAEGMRLADEAARDRPDLLGAFVPRETALAMPNVAQLWHVADHIVTDDSRVASVDAWLHHD